MNQIDIEKIKHALRSTAGVPGMKLLWISRITKMSYEVVQIVNTPHGETAAVLDNDQEILLDHSRFIEEFALRTRLS